MDTKRKTVTSTSRKYTKKDIKMCGAESLKSSALSTPPQTKNCRTPLMSRKCRIQDDYDGYNSEEASPVLLSTQEGGRGCEVTWDWRSPNRSEITPHNTPKEKVRRRVIHKNSVSPLLHIPCKRKIQQPTNKTFFDNLHAQLAEIQQKYQSSKTNCPNKTSPSGPKPIVKQELEDISLLPTQILSNETTSQPPEKRETSGISDFFRDDSFTDYLITCSQAVENTIKKEPDLNKNNITRKNNQRDKSPDLFFDDETANYPSDLVQSTPTIPNDTTVKEKQFKNLCTKSPKFGNDDSFDAIISTFSEEAFAEYSDGSNKKNTKCDNTNTKVGSFLNFTSNLQSIEEDKEQDFNKIITDTVIKEEDYTNVKSNKTIAKDLPKPGFSRHNSMPISPRVLGSNFQQGSVGRHNSMPYNSGNKLYNQRQRSLSDRTDSLESLGSQSCSPIQCTPDEIEKKRQDALRKKEARRIKLEIERKRLEAIEKLQMKNKLQAHKNPR